MRCCPWASDAPTLIIARRSFIAVLSGDMRPLSLHVHGVDGLTGGHEQAIAPWTAEAQVRTDLRQQDLADPLSFGIEDMDAVVSGADPSRTHPQVPVFIR